MDELDKGESIIAIPKSAFADGLKLVNGGVLHIEMDIAVTALDFSYKGMHIAGYSLDGAKVSVIERDLSTNDEY